MAIKNYISFKVRRSKIIALYFFLLLSGTLYSQRFSAGLSGGITATQVGGDALGGFDKPGATVGGFVSTSFSKNWSAQFEILYVQKGSKGVGDSLPYPYSTSSYGGYYLMSLQYLEVPLLLSYHYKKFQVETGPSIGFLIGASETTLYKTENTLSTFSRLELAYSIGANYPLGKNFYLNLRFSNSVLPIRQPAGVVSYPSFIYTGQYNTVLLLSLRYYFFSENQEK